MAVYLLALMGAFAATLALTPLVRWIASRNAITDNPDGCRKLQKQPVPLLGGVAVLGGWWIGVAIFGLADPAATLPRAALPAAIALILLAIMGVLDDVYRLRARWKLLGQALAVLPIVMAGYSLDRIALGSYSLELGVFAAPAAPFWLVLGINSLNLLDGMDGMASVISAGVAATLVAIAALSGQPGIILVMLPLVGALFGFLAFNYPPAKIYIGDAGTSVIGFALALASLIAAKAGHGPTHVPILLAIMAIPVADTTLAVLRRSLAGRGFWHPDRCAHPPSTSRSGLRPKQILLLFVGVSAVWAPIVVIANQRQSDSLALGAAVIAAFLAVRLRVAGHHEWVLLTGWIRRSLARGVSAPPSPAKLREMPFDVAWDHLVTRIRRQPIQAIILAIEDPDGSLAEHSWRHAEVGSAASVIEIVAQPSPGSLLPAANRVVAVRRHGRMVAVDRDRQSLCKVLGRASRDDSADALPLSERVASGVSEVLANQDHRCREASGLASIRETAMDKKIILFELNEVPLRVIDQFCRWSPALLLARRLGECHQYETFTEDVGHLSPWTTWPTLHRGVPGPRHLIANFGQDNRTVDREFPPLWDLLARHGIRTGICGSLHSYPMPSDLNHYAFYLPDTFAAGSECFPNRLATFQDFNLRMARESAMNVSTRLPWQAALNVLAAAPGLGFRLRTLADVGVQLVSERLQTCARYAAGPIRPCWPSTSS